MVDVLETLHLDNYEEYDGFCFCHTGHYLNQYWELLYNKPMVDMF